MHISAFCMAVSTDLDSVVASILKYFSNMSTYVQNALILVMIHQVNLGRETSEMTMNLN